MKKFILITINLILIGLIAFLGFYYLSEGGGKESIGISGKGSLLSQFTSTHTNKDPQAVRVSSSSVVDYTISLDSKSITYLDSEGGLITSDLIGKEIISETQLIDGKALSALWSPTNSEVIVTTIERGRVQRTLYNLTEDTRAPLNEGIQDLAFSPKGNRIVYSFYNEYTYEGNISISNPDGSRFMNVFQTRMPDAVVHWPKEPTAYFYKNPTGEQAVDLFSLDLETQRIENILKDKEGLKIAWSPNGDHIVYSESTKTGSRLVYKNMKTEDEEEIELETTADHCVWSPDNVNVFCYETNQFYKIDTADNSLEDIFKFKAPNEISNLKITPLGNQLFFFNEEDGHLYTLILR